MAAVLPSTNTEPSEVHDTFTGRKWPRKAVDQVIVGKIFGTYDWLETWIYLGMDDESFGDVTDKELQRFWDEVLTQTTIVEFWSAKTREDAEVIKVLEDIKKVMDHWKDIYENDDGFETLMRKIDALGEFFSEANLGKTGIEETYDPPTILKNTDKKMSEATNIEETGIEETFDFESMVRELDEWNKWMSEVMNTEETGTE